MNNRGSKYLRLVCTQIIFVGGISREALQPSARQVSEEESSVLRGARQINLTDAYGNSRFVM